MVTMEMKQNIFSSFYVLCECKEYPNSLQNFKSLRVRVPEMTGGGVCGGVNPPLSIRCGYQIMVRVKMGHLQQYENSPQYCGYNGNKFFLALLLKF